ncbi:MAG: ComEA family DNA-binding protein [Planctomycetota bacterium]|jgi:hypothetical protein
MDSRIAHKCKEPGGSALVLVVVLVSLLAVVGMMFFMTARVNNMGVSAVSENKELGFAIETVIARISEQLVADVPGSNTVAGYAEYYDYPGPNDPWLAALEPVLDDNDTPLDTNDDVYKWPQISDVYNKLGLILELPAEIIPDYQDSSNVNEGEPADADGDGVADSKWIKVNDITSNKGRPIYAAIRIIDNGGMMNVNTAYEFDPNGGLERIDGSSQTQINLFALAQRGTSNTIGQLDDARFGSELHDLNNYIRDVVWCYNKPNGGYTPFDISDELELRNRFIVKQVDTQTRIKNLWIDVFKVGVWTPFDSSNFSKWPEKVTYIDVNSYDYRHIATTYNFDRIINPLGGRMVNINDANANEIYTVLNAVLGGVVSQGTLAQLAVNTADFADDDVIVSVLPGGFQDYYGFEAQPFISEVGIKAEPGKASYAVELYNPFDVNIPLNNFGLDIYTDANLVSIYRSIVFGPNEVIDARNYFVIFNNDVFGVPDRTDPNLRVFGDWNPPIDPNATSPPDSNGILRLRQGTEDGGRVYVDREIFNRYLAPSVNDVQRFFARDNKEWQILYPGMWIEAAATFWGENLADSNSLEINLSGFWQRFITVGDIGKLLTIGSDSANTIGETLLTVVGGGGGESDVRLNLQEPVFRNIFQYLTAFDPAEHIPDPNETRIKGRININTAPWYVMAQLPWVSEQLAQAIVAYRDKLDLSPAGGPNYNRPIDQSRPFGFGSIGELNLVNESGSVDPNHDYSIIKYFLDGFDMDGYPDLTYSDGIEDDFEERDVIFSRISNLATVRSDVFTAYILVRLGTDGPQKRVIAILDRSGATIGNDRVKVVALHLVPDPR